MKDEKEGKIEPTLNKRLLGKVGLAPSDDSAAKEYPTLCELLFPVYDEKKRLTREAGVLSLRIDGQLYRVTLVCPTEGVQTTLETTTLLDLFEQLERHCYGTSAAWVPTYDRKKKAGQHLKRVLD